MLAVQHNHGPERIAAARRDLAFAHCVRTLRERLSAVEPLTAEQRTELIELVTTNGGGRNG